MSLTDKDWNEIRSAVDEVVDRQVDDQVFRGGRVYREAGGSIILRLEHTVFMGGLNLEPVAIEDGPWQQEAADKIISRNVDPTSGAGWPD